MPDDALAKAAYVAYIAGMSGWSKTEAAAYYDKFVTAEGKQRWAEVARAVLEAAGYDVLQQLAKAVASIAPDSAASASAILRFWARDKEDKQGYVSGEITWLNRVATALEKVERSGLFGPEVAQWHQ